jgi:hypothetical protein
MHFLIKSILKSNRNHISKQVYLSYKLHTYFHIHMHLFIYFYFSYLQPYALTVSAHHVQVSLNK